MIENLIVGLIVLVAFCFLIIRVYQSLKNGGCNGCCKGGSCDTCCNNTPDDCQCKSQSVVGPKDDLHGK